MFFFSRHIFYYSRILKYTLVQLQYKYTVLQCLGGRDTAAHYALVDITSYKVVYIHTYQLVYTAFALSLSVFFTKGPSSCVLKIQKDHAASIYRESGFVPPAFTSFLAKGGREPTRPPTYIQPFETFFLAFTGLSEYIYIYREHTTHTKFSLLFLSLYSVLHK